MFIPCGWHVHLRFHATCPTGRQTMKAEIDTPIFVEGFPVGAVAAFLASLDGCPDLPSNFELCDGHVCENEASPFFGVSLPDLNGAIAGNQRFLRGAALSGATGGQDSVSLSLAEIAAHTHTVPAQGSIFTGGGTVVARVGGSGTLTSSSAGSGTAHENRPAFYEVVWIIRVV